MKLLVISALYPPCHLGGYELRIKNIMDELKQRGYEIRVLTSKCESKNELTEINNTYPVERLLYGKSRNIGFTDRMTLIPLLSKLGILLVFIRELIHDIKDLELIDSIRKKFQPDLIYLGHILPITRSLMPYLAECKEPIIFDEGGLGMVLSRQKKSLWYRFIDEYSYKFIPFDWLKNILIGIISKKTKGKIKQEWKWPANLHIFFNSNLNLKNAVQQGLQVGNAKIIYSGVDVNNFDYSDSKNFNTPIKIIIPGRITPPKGQLDGIRLLVALRKRNIASDLWIVGEKWDQSYVWQIQDEIKRYNLDENVLFFPKISQVELSDLYKKADICFFPSYHRTGFSRTPLEAMASGCVVISYGNEGSNEIIRTNENGFLVEPGNFDEIVKIINQLKSDSDQLKKIKRSARFLIEKDFSLENYVDEIEKVLKNAI